jgi:hypothetical protein
MSKPGEERFDEEGNNKIWEDDDVTSYWLKHYVGDDGNCALCGNHGRVELGSADYTADGKVIEKPFCICPNGQAMRWHLKTSPQSK